MGELLSPGEIWYDIMKEEGVERFFGVISGHADMFWALCEEYGIKALCFRHEQGAGYAADGYAAVSRKHGITVGASGPGLTNMVSAIAQSYQAMRPMIAMIGMQGPTGDHRWTLQDCYPEHVTGSCSKLTHVVNATQALPYWFRRAFRESMSYPQGPVVLGIPTWFATKRLEVEQYPGFSPEAKEVCAPPIYRTQADPAAVDIAVKAILQAERPLLMVGDGAWWSFADEELKEFVELTRIPVCCRRTARGMIPDTHPLSIETGYRSKCLAESDLVVLLGLREGVTEGHFYFPVWGNYPPGAKYIQINEAESEMVDYLPSVVRTGGSVKLVLRQMIDCAKDLLSVKKPDWSKWHTTIAEARESFWKKSEGLAKSEINMSPVRGSVYGHAIGELVKAYPGTTVVLDSFTGSLYASDSVRATIGSQIVDAAGWSGIGHGIGMSIGISEARPNAPVLVVMGDGGMGIGGMDIETAIRFNQPVIYLVYNDSQWMNASWELLYKTGFGVDNRMIENQRYDQMFEICGAHGEYVTNSAELAPALLRAAKVSMEKRKPSVVNAIVDRNEGHPWLMILYTLYVRSFGLDKIAPHFTDLAKDLPVVKAFGGDLAKMFEFYANKGLPGISLVEPDSFEKYLKGRAKK